MNLDTVCMLVLEFFLFSVLGWCMEVALKAIQYHRFINRGFLIGPYCPIYGFGVTVVTVLVGGLIGRHGTVGETFLAGFVLCGALEYFTSWYMEKLFHARWWDYSRKPMNLHGRIWIGNLILFGAASVVIVRWIDPPLFRLLGRLPPFWLHLLALAVPVLLLADYTVSHVLMTLVKKEIDCQEGDNTEEISRRVRELLRDRNLLLRRIQSAYPEMCARPRPMVEKYRAARQAFRREKKRFHALLKEAIRARRAPDYEAGRWEQALADGLRARRAAAQALRAIQRKIFVRHDDLDDPPAPPWDCR